MNPKCVLPRLGFALCVGELSCVPVYYITAAAGDLPGRGATPSW